MKLPGIDYSGAVPSIGNAYERVGAASERFTGVIGEGLAAMGRELVKTQSQQAAADLHEGLATLENDLASRRYVSTQFVRDQLGPAIDQLPEPVRAQLTRRQHNVVTDEGYDADREDIPTWLVAGALYDKRAKELVRASSQGITGQGWQAAFQDAALADLVQRRAKVAHDSTSAFLEDQKQTQRATIQQYVRLGAHDRALEVVDQSDAFTPGEKALLREDVLKVRNDAALTVRADEKSRELEAAHPGDPQAAMKEAQALGGELGIKVAQRLADRDRLRTEAQADEVKDRKGRLELGVRTSQIVAVSQLEQLDDYKALPQWAQADVVATMNSVAEQRLRLSQLTSDKQWQQELSRFQGLSDREKVAQWPDYQAKVPFQYSGGFAQVYETARVRLTNAWDSEDVQKTFDLAGKVLKWPTGSVQAARLRESGRRWYDAETRRQNGVPPTQAEASKWLAERLQWGDENGDDWGGGSNRFRFQAEAEAERTGEPVRFAPFNAGEQKYPPAALLVRGAPAPDALPPVPPGGTPHDLTKPIIRNADGSFSTEKTVTFQIDGKWVVMASIVGGKEYSAQEALKLYRQGKNPAVGTFDTLAEADKYAIQRHNEEAQLRAAAAARVPAPPVAGAVHITNGTQDGWLPPGKAMPAGWRKAQ